VDAATPAMTLSVSPSQQPLKLRLH